MTRHLAPRSILALAAAAMLGATALPASAMDGSYLEHVPNWISTSNFSTMSAHELHLVDHAHSRGRPVVIEGYALSDRSMPRCRR